MLRFSRGNFGYRVRWNPQATQVFILGGDGDLFDGSPRYAGEVLGFNFTGTTLTPLDGGALPTGVDPSDPVFPSTDTLVIRNRGGRSASSPRADVRAFSTGGGALRAGGPVGNVDGGFWNLAPFLSRDGRYVVAGDASYSVQGATVAVLDRVSRGMLRISSTDAILGSTQMHGSFVLVAAVRLSGTPGVVLGSFRLGGDGAFSPVGTVLEQPSASEFHWGALLGGHVFWMADGRTSEVFTLTMDDAGQLSSFRRQSFVIPAPVSTYVCGSDFGGRFLYCFRGVEALAATVANDGTLTGFSPFAGPTSFSFGTGFVISKP